MTSPYKVYQEGQIAYEEGKSVLDCPYSVVEEEQNYMDWHEGYDYAQSFEYFN